MHMHFNMHFIRRSSKEKQYGKVNNAGNEGDKSLGFIKWYGFTPPQKFAHKTAIILPHLHGNNSLSGFDFRVGIGIFINWMNLPCIENRYLDTILPRKFCQRRIAYLVVIWEIFSKNFLKTYWQNKAYLL